MFGKGGSIASIKNKIKFYFEQRSGAQLQIQSSTFRKFIETRFRSYFFPLYYEGLYCVTFSRYNIYISDLVWTLNHVKEIIYQCSRHHATYHFNEIPLFKWQKYM